MTDEWTSEDIEAILVQLNDRSLPFRKHCFSGLGEGLCPLGKGGFAKVYGAQERGRGAQRWAIKVIGFGDKRLDPDEFRKMAQLQKDVGYLQKNIVRVYAYTQLKVRIEGAHTVVDVKLLSQKEEDPEERGNWLYLQFVLMEKLVQAIRIDENGRRPFVAVRGFSPYEEKEILRFAYDIGIALARVHEKGLLHRDIKLENVFFSPRSNCYKLGDFGIARVTDNGFASTVAFTKGYGAPEVVSAADERYDAAADIYSFGMMLYLLLNGLKFPDSSGYRANVERQYSQGYVLPDPQNGSDELRAVVRKMCSFDADERYQSMEEVLNALEQVIYGFGVRLRREHRDLSLALGSAFAITGAAVWKAAFAADRAVSFSWEMYLFCGLCMWKGLFKLQKKDPVIPGIAILGCGIRILARSGFSWGALSALIVLALFADVLTGLFGAAALTVHAVWIVQMSDPAVIQGAAELKWLAVLLLSLALVFLLNYDWLQDRDEGLIRSYFEKNRYWLFILSMYASMILCGCSIMITDYLRPAYLPHITAFIERWGLREWKLARAGCCGELACVLWILREKVLEKFYAMIGKG